MTNNSNWVHIDEKYIWHPFDAINTKDNIVIDRGEGIYLIDIEGNKIIDAIGSWWVNIHGHAHPKMIDTLTKQAGKLEHVIFSGFTHEPAITFSKKLIEISGSEYSKVFYSDNGSTAVEVALKMSFQYWHNISRKRIKVLAIEGAYHGDTFGAMSAGDRSKFNEPFFPFLFDVEFIPFPESHLESEILEQIATKTSTGEYACFIFEPLVQGAAGMRTYTFDFLKSALEICRRQNVITIADEVFTGFYRTGRFLASHYIEGITPDIICLSKAITGGYLPLGATICKEFVFSEFQTNDVYKTFFHGHSYTGNPLALALANCSIDLLLTEQSQHNISKIIDSHRSFVVRLSKKFSFVKINHIGTIVSIAILSDNTKGYFSNIKELIYHYFIDRNILLRPLGNVIYFLPMYCFEQDQLDLVYDEIELFLTKMDAKEI